MFSAHRYEPRRPFPAVSAAVKAQYAVGPLALRPFGLYESDLHVDFANTPRPLLVTQILACCTTSDAERAQIDQRFFWSLTVGQRIECLLHLLAADEQAEIALALRCPRAACGQELELELSVAELATLQARAYTVEQITLQVAGAQLTLRRPTGNDQLDWLQRRFAAEDMAVKAMLRTLLLDGAETALIDAAAVPADLVGAVNQAMEEHDPLVNFSLQVQCPDCAAESPHELDLEALALRRLRLAQTRLLASVHRLAAHYHWSEPEIFAVPYWRRAVYLSLIAQEQTS